jgi:hypothetical protein
MTNTKTNELVEQIKAELSRLDTLGTADTPCDMVVNALDDLPAGWVQVTDDIVSFYGPAAEILERLKAVEIEGPTDPEDAYSEVWESLRGLNENHPLGGLSIGNAEDRAYNDGGVDFTGEVVAGDLELFTVETNAGTRWGFAPHDNDYAAFNSFIAFSGLHESREDALDAAEEHAARQEMEEEIAQARDDSDERWMQEQAEAIAAQDDRDSAADLEEEIRAQEWRNG